MQYNKKAFKVKIKKGPKVQDLKGVQDSFAYVLKTVEDGWSIYEAIEIAGVANKAFYKHITEEQKALLRFAKTSHTKFGTPSKVKGSNGKPALAKEREEEDEFKDLIEKSPYQNWDFDDLVM
jgi:hypothetical protein